MVMVMTDEPRGQGLDASAPTDRSSSDQQPTSPGTADPTPAYEPGPGHSSYQGPGHQGAAYPGSGVPAPYGPLPWQPGSAYGATPPPGGPPPGTAPSPFPGSPFPGKQPRRPGPVTGIVVTAVVAAVIGGGAGFGGAYAVFNSAVPGSSSLASSHATNASNAVLGSVEAAAEKAIPSTVDIQANVAQGISEGSGVILTADGDVLTNNHVVAGSTGALTVTLSDGSEHPATVVGTSPSYDLAVIKLQGVSGLTPATLGQSSDVKVGQQVVAIGSPQGLTGTVTSGIVSALDRTVAEQGQDGSTVVYNGLQTDAPINHGNSGGPLVNLDGQVTGINSVILSSSEDSGSIGLGFSIPVDQAKRVAQEIMSTGSATKPVLGVTGSTRQQSAAEGAQIAGVQPGSPAAGAGLTAGEIVTKVGDTKVQDFADLIARIGSYAPGSAVTLTVTDAQGGAQKTVDVTLGSQPDKAASTGTGGESTDPFGQGGGSPFGNGPFGGGR
jgi:putative serine protease PepD